MTLTSRLYMDSFKSDLKTLLFPILYTAAMFSVPFIFIHSKPPGRLLPVFKLRIFSFV